MSPRPDEFVLRDAGVPQEWCDGGFGMMPIRFVIESGGSYGSSSDCILHYSAKGSNLHGELGFFLLLFPDFPLSRDTINWDSNL